MRKSILSVLIMWMFFSFHKDCIAQETEESAIHQLEKMVGEAFTKKGTATLLKLLSLQLLVNTPLNRVATIDYAMHLIRVGIINESADEKVI